MLGLSIGPLEIGLITTTGLAVVLGVARWPRQALMACFLLVLLANTKFRSRDTGALLTGQVDAQIFFELGIYGLIAAVLLLNLLRLPRQDLRLNNWAELMLLGYVLLVFTSIMWAPNTDITAVRALQLGILYLLAFVAVRALGGPAMLNAITVSVMLYVLVFASAALLIPAADGTETTYTGIERFTWFSVHPILAATFAATGAIFAVAMTKNTHPSRHHYLLFCVAGLLIAVLLATRSRGPILAFAVAFVTITSLSLVTARYHEFFRSAALLTLTAAGAVLVLLTYELRSMGTTYTAQPNPVVAFFLRGQTTTQLAGFSGREELWELVFALFTERPVLGHGYLASRSVLLERFPWAGTAHNGYFESLLNLGIIGAFLVVVPLFAVLIGSVLILIRAPANQAGFLSTVLGGVSFLAVNAVSTEGFAGYPGYEPMLLFALVIAYFQHTRLGNAPHDKDPGQERSYRRSRVEILSTTGSTRLVT